jgi:hypothetical protein
VIEALYRLSVNPKPTKCAKTERDQREGRPVLSRTMSWGSGSRKSPI